MDFEETEQSWRCGEDFDDRVAENVTRVVDAARIGLGSVGPGTVLVDVAAEIDDTTEESVVAAAYVVAVAARFVVAEVVVVVENVVGIVTGADGDSLYDVPAPCDVSRDVDRGLFLSRTWNGSWLPFSPLGKVLSRRSKIGQNPKFEF